MMQRHVECHVRHYSQSLMTHVWKLGFCWWPQLFCFYQNCVSAISNAGGNFSLWPWLLLIKWKTLYSKGAKELLNYSTLETRSRVKKKKKKGRACRRQNFTVWKSHRILLYWGRVKGLTLCIIWIRNCTQNSPYLSGIMLFYTLVLDHWTVSFLFPEKISLWKEQA